MVDRIDLSTSPHFLNKSSQYIGHFFVQCAPGRQIALYVNDQISWQGSSQGLKFIVAELGHLHKDEGIHLELRTNDLFPFADHATSKTKTLIGCFWIEMQIFEKDDVEERVKSLEHFVEVT